MHLLWSLISWQGLREGGQGGDMPDIFEHIFGGGGGMGGMGGFFGMPFGGMGMGGPMGGPMGGGRGGRRRPQKGEDTLHPLKYVASHVFGYCWSWNFVRSVFITIRFIHTIHAVVTL